MKPFLQEEYQPVRIVWIIVEKTFAMWFKIQDTRFFDKIETVRSRDAVRKNFSQ